MLKYDHAGANHADANHAVHKDCDAHWNDEYYDNVDLILLIVPDSNDLDDNVEICMNVNFLHNIGV